MTRMIQRVSPGVLCRRAVSPVQVFNLEVCTLIKKKLWPIYGTCTALTLVPATKKKWQGLRRGATKQCQEPPRAYIRRGLLSGKVSNDSSGGEWGRGAENDG